MHISVLLQPILENFRSKQIRIFVDATLGAAGHSLAICQQHPEIECLVGFDQDPVALEIATQILEPLTCKKLLIHSNFRHLSRELASRGITQVDGLIFDLGVSSMQLDTAQRGFSFQQDGPLDMRMNPELDVTAQDIVNQWSEKDLADLFFELGEERHSRRAAKAICQARKRSRIDSTAKLVECLQSAIPSSGPIHRATRVFQALRLAVNQELEVLEAVIPQAAALLAPDGLLGIISFHSLEDRIVKHAFRSLCKEREDLEIVTKKPIIASSEECRYNRRSRSAKLRLLHRHKNDASAL